MAATTIPKSAFANADARAPCPTPDCLGDLVLMPTGRVDRDGVPGFLDDTLCPLCMTSIRLEPDIEDRDLYLRIAWLRANPDAPPDADGAG